MRVGIAGYGSIGQFIAELFGARHDLVLYDPPKGLGSAEALDDCDFVFICVPTPPRPDGSCDTTAVEEMVASVTPRRALICHSTVAIGTTERLLQLYGKPLVYVPEYAGERPDHPYRNVENQTFLFLGGRPGETAAVEELYRTVLPDATRYYHVPPTVAEVVKYMENAFLALKVTFCNEFYDLCRALGVDYELVRSLWVQDFRIGESHTRVTPERGYGGKCLPKDVAAVCATARSLGVPLELLETAQRVNERVRSVLPAFV